MVPSMRPSTKSDSAPLISPLITSERPIVACSMGALEAFTGAYVFGLDAMGVAFLFSGGCNMDTDLP